MIKKPVSLLIFLNVILIIMIIVFWSFLQTSMEMNKYNVDKFYSRKEDLLSQQQQLELVIKDLNSTLQDEIKTNGDLKIDLAKLSKDVVTQQTIIEQNKALPPPAPPPVIPKVVTKAS